ncbi:IF-2B-domain-containing protein [Venturia nashicola]|uniref:Translation initiation factor eIF2B subunit delta n=1 Tax=Venturia nashicola TaxID=86259 RepID=A0A4Z1PBV2_9PEZI|nr:IF-2B-domain-containing protein [Venturia nashicola]
MENTTLPEETRIPTMNGASDSPPQANGAPQPPPKAAPPEEKKLSGKELKAQKQAEKAARRAEKQTAPPPAAAGPSAPAPSQKGSQKQSSKGAPAPGKAPAGTGTGTSQPATMPVRNRRASTSAPAVKPVVAAPKPKAKQVGLFGHLYGHPRRYGIEGASKDVHPSVLALGLHMSNYEICGSTARCVAMLLVFKSVIQSYTTPTGHALARHFIPHCLSPQIEYLKSCRTISVSMGNAIRILKDAIANVDPSTSDERAKADLCECIDTFLRERITAADELIAKTAADKISEGDVIITFAKSSLVLKSLLRAKKLGKSFRVIVLDSKPLFEGKRMAEDLATADIPVQYSLISAAAHAVGNATKVFLGAHAMMANGRLYSRVGTAIVAMLAHDKDIPVIVCCESYKFTDRVALDSIVANEIAPPEELLSNRNETDEERHDTLKTWKETPGLQILNILHDVTPAEYIKMVITEFGSLPPSSVPATLRFMEESGR